MQIYAIIESVLMGLDVLGTVLELKAKDPITIGGRANKRYREYLLSLIPEDYEPDKDPETRLKKYFQAQGLKLAPLNVYSAWIATFLSWTIFPIIQPINLYRLIRHRLNPSKRSNIDLCAHACMSSRLSVINLKQRTQMLNDAQVVQLKGNEYFVYEGMPVHGLYLICKGKVELERTQYCEHGEPLLNTLVAGDLIGDDIISESSYYTYNAKTLESSVLCYYPLKTIRRLLKNGQSIDLKICKGSAEALHISL